MRYTYKGEIYEVSLLKLGVLLLIPVIALVFWGYKALRNISSGPSKIQAPHSTANPALPTVTPSTNDKIAAVVTGEGSATAAVFDRGGDPAKRELWVAIPTADNQLSWQPITSAVELGDGSPIAIKRNTLFWVSPGAVALQAYEITSGQRFSITIEPSDPYTSPLLFESGQWQAVYVDNQFKFAPLGTQDWSSSERDEKVTEKFQQMFSR
jgi:hypothetical protein